MGNDERNKKQEQFPWNEIDAEQKKAMKMAIKIFCLESARFAINILACLSLCRVITIDPAWFCLPSCILSLKASLSMSITMWRAMRRDARQMFMKDAEERIRKDICRK